MTSSYKRLNEVPNVVEMSLGFGLGSKWVSKKRFLFEINADYRELLFNADKTDHDLVAKFGFPLGYRFYFNEIH
jgi:hypothetical protein